MSGKQMSALPSKFAKVETVPYNPTVDAALRGARLAAIQETFTRSDLWFEVNLLDKLMYKSKNQHKAAKHFHKLQEVKRSLRLLKALQLAEVIGDLNSLCETSSMGMSSSAAVVLYSSSNKLRLPCQQAGVLAMQRISSACCVAVQMLPAVHAGAAQLLAQLGMTYFMPFCLSALSMLARVQVLVSQLLLDCVKAYNSLMPLVVMLPRSGASRQPPGQQYPDLPHMLSCTWEAGLPSLNSIPFSDHAHFTSAAIGFAQHRYAAGPASTGKPQPHIAQHTVDPEDMGEKISRSSIPIVPVYRACVADRHGTAHSEDVGEAVPRSSASTLTHVTNTNSDLGRAMPSSCTSTPVDSQASFTSMQTDLRLQPECKLQGDSTRQFAQAPAAVQGQRLHTKGSQSNAEDHQQQSCSTEQQQQQEHLAAEQQTHQAGNAAQQQQATRFLAKETAHTLDGSAGLGHMRQLSPSEKAITPPSAEAAKAASRHMPYLARPSEVSDTRPAAGDLLVFEDR